MDASTIASSINAQPVRSNFHVLAKLDYVVSLLQCCRLRKCHLRIQLQHSPWRLKFNKLTTHWCPSVSKPKSAKGTNNSVIAFKCQVKRCQRHYRPNKPNVTHRIIKHRWCDYCHADALLREPTTRHGKKFSGSAFRFVCRVAFVGLKTGKNNFLLNDVFASCGIKSQDVPTITRIPFKVIFAIN